jgi:hypothetical protein
MYVATNKHPTTQDVVFYAATAKQRYGKHMSAAMNECATVEEPLGAMSSIQSMLKLYIEDQQQQLSQSTVSQRLLQAISNRCVYC